MTMRSRVAAALLIVLAASLTKAQDSRSWLDKNRSPDERAELAVSAMTLDEQLTLLHGPVAISIPVPGLKAVALPADAIPAAGYVPGVPRLGIPALRETDGSLGVTNPLGTRPGDVATALPSGLALAATFDPSLAYQAGALVGREAHSKGFNVLLGGGMNLARDPRNGRNFEYLGEDPLLAGVMAGEEVRGTQDQHVISTVKHFALNANETNRQTLNARIDKTALRESDLLAFNIAIERGKPGSVMCAYNSVNGEHACANGWLLNDVLKHDWGYRGWVMSDWGAVHATEDALRGLDQQSGEQSDSSVWFGESLKKAVERGTVPAARVHDMARRVLRSMFAVGIVGDPPIKTEIDYTIGSALALKIAHQGIVLLKNESLILPLAAGTHKIAVIGGYAGVGVLSGGGSSQVMPSNGSVIRIPMDGRGVTAIFHDQILEPSAPLEAMSAASPGSQVEYDPGAFPADAAALAARCDVAIVFVTRHELEGFDVPTLDLPYGQNELVEAVAKANPRTIVVLETGNPISMPWIDRVAAVLTAWYPGQEGGQAIADILFGSVNPSGRLPITFPKADTQTVRPMLPNLGSAADAEVSIDYSEGADVGYRWYHTHGINPLFSFGHGLSYARFEYTNLKISSVKPVTVTFDVANTGVRPGADVPQIYLTGVPGGSALRLLAFQRVELKAGERRSVTATVDPRLIASFDEARRMWVATPGTYTLSIGKSASDFTANVRTHVRGYSIPAGPIDMSR
jgi:beta-glucosidase